MRHFMLAVVTALSIALAPSLTRAGDTATDAQHIITSQIDAFLNDDMQKAYSYASPGIKRMYPTPDAFFKMVRKGYEPVYRPGNFAFGRSKVGAGGDQIVQEVLINGPKGQDWTAIYTLQRESDGSLKITSVHIVKSAPPSA